MHDEIFSAVCKSTHRLDSETGGDMAEGRRDAAVLLTHISAGHRAANAGYVGQRGGPRRLVSTKNAELASEIVITRAGSVSVRSHP